jgi:hypothetical protein
MIINAPDAAEISCLNASPLPCWTYFADYLRMTILVVLLTPPLQVFTGRKTTKRRRSTRTAHFFMCIIRVRLKISVDAP